MVSRAEIELLLSNIPPLTHDVARAFLALQKGETAQAATLLISQADIVAYFRKVVKSPLYGFRQTPTDLGQILSLLGSRQAYAMLTTYMSTKIAPKAWKIFDLTTAQFLDFNTMLNKKWEAIVLHVVPHESDHVMSAASLMGLSVAVAEGLLAAREEDINLLRRHGSFSINNALLKLTEMTLFDIAADIAKIWEFDDDVIALVKASGDGCMDQGGALAPWLHLLLFDTSLQAQFCNTQINSLMHLNMDAIAPIGSIYQDIVQDL